MSKELLWTFPVTIQSLFEEKSTGVLRTIKPITDTVIIQLFKSIFILEIYSILFLWNSSLVLILSMALVLTYEQSALISE